MELLWTLSPPDSRAKSRAEACHKHWRNSVLPLLAAAVDVPAEVASQNRSNKPFTATIPSQPHTVLTQTFLVLAREFESLHMAAAAAAAASEFESQQIPAAKCNRPRGTAGRRG